VDELPQGTRDEIANEPDARATAASRRHRVVAWTTLGGLGAVAVAAGAYAATTGGSPATVGTAATGEDVVSSTAPTAPPSLNPSAPAGGPARPGGRGHGGPGFGPVGPGAFGPGAGRVLHGEATVVLPSGGTQIVDTQSGTISAIDASKNLVTVKSSDNVSFSYTVDSTTHLFVATAATPGTATIADLKVGDTVMVRAVRTGDTRTAETIMDGKPTMAAGRGPGGWGGPGDGRGPKPTAPPSASASAASA
jgi:hypothetical protein